MAFADAFIRGVTAGQQTRSRQTDQQFREEDRAIEKEVLQHRLRELKIGERLQAREAARENLSGLQGLPEAQMPPSQLEGIPSSPLAGVLAGGEITPTPEVQQPLSARPVSIPGIPELGVEGIERRPETFEQLLGQRMSQERLLGLERLRQELARPVALSPGASLVQPLTGQTLIQGAGRARGLQTVEVQVEGMRGRQRATFDPESGSYTVRGQDVTDRVRGVEPTSLISLGQREGDAREILSGIQSGDISPTLDGLDRVTRTKVVAAASRAGFPLRAAQNDARAVRAHVSTMNSQQFTRFRAAAANAMSLLDEVERLNQDIRGRTGLRSLNRGVLASQARGVGVDEEGQQRAIDFVTAMDALQESVAEVQSGGAASTNLALERAANTLSSDFSQAQLSSTLRSLRLHLTRRVGSLADLEPVFAPGREAAPAQAAPAPAQGVTITVQGQAFTFPNQEAADAFAAAAAQGG